MNKKAMSELSGAVILAIATIGIGSLVAQQLIGYTISAKSSIASQYRKVSDAEGQLLTTIYQWSNITHTALLLFNYGWHEVSIKSLFVDGFRLGDWTTDRSVVKPRETMLLWLKGMGQNLTIVTNLDKILTFRLP